MISLHLNKEDLIGKSEEEITHLLKRVENKWFVYEECDLRGKELILREICSSLEESKDFIGFIARNISSPGASLKFKIQRWRHEDESRVSGSECSINKNKDNGHVVWYCNDIVE